MNNSQCAHNWANKVKLNGKGSNMFFENETIYSYGRHFAIAKFINDANGNELVAYNCRNYSNTTSKHQTHVLHSIPSYYEIIRCVDMDFGYYSHKNNLFYYVNNANLSLQKAKKSIKYKTINIVHANSYVSQFRKYVSVFGLDLNNFNSLSNEHENLDIIFKNCVNEIEIYCNSNEYKAWQIKDEQKKKDKEEKDLLKNAENVIKFRNFQTKYVYNIPFNILRHNKETNNVETNSGIVMPLPLFLKYYNMLKNNELTIGQNIENYRYTGHSETIVFVGCHKIEISEIENLIQSI